MEGIRKFLAAESGATSVEYALIMMLIAGAIVAAVTLLGESLRPIYSNMADQVKTPG
jgi:Flp pilus assembly pilin Flp